MKYSNMTHTTCCPKVSVSWTRPPAHRPRDIAVRLTIEIKLIETRLAKLIQATTTTQQQQRVTNYEVL